MIEQKTNSLNFDHGLSRSWMTESHINPVMFVSPEREKLSSSETLQLPRRVGESSTAVGPYNVEQLSCVQAPYNLGGLQRPQVVPNLEEKGIGFTNCNTSADACSTDNYRYETLTNDEWNQEDDEHLVNYENGLSIDWECSLIRQSIEDKELEIYLPRNLSPTPLDHLYSTLPVNEKEIKWPLERYDRDRDRNSEDKDGASVKRGQTIHQFPMELNRTNEPFDRCFSDRKVPLCADIRNRYSVSSIRQRDALESKSGFAYNCTTPYTRNYQTTRSENHKDDSTLLQTRQCMPSDNCLQKLPIMSTKIMSTEPILRERGQPKAFALAEKDAFSSQSRYSRIDRSSDYECVVTYQHPVSLQQNNNNDNAMSPLVPRVQDFSCSGPILDGGQFQESPTKPDKTLRTLEPSSYYAPNGHRPDALEEHHGLESDHSNCSGVILENVSSRLTHNDIERQRRNQMKVKFDHLKACLPDISKCERSPKILVLNRAKDYIHWLQKESRTLEMDKEKIKKTNRVLLQKLVLLTGQVKDMAGI